MRDITKVFKSLSEETRLRILNILMERECCVCEVMQVLGISQSRASRNLNALYDAGLLTQKKEGLWCVYSIDKQDMKEYQSQLVKAVKEALRDSKIALRDKERLKIAERVGPGCVQRMRLKVKSA